MANTDANTFIESERERKAKIREAIQRRKDREGIKIYTGYFNMMQQYIDANCLMISIARTLPKWMKSLQWCEKLIPSKELFKDRHNITPEEYAERYRAEHPAKEVAKTVKRLRDDTYYKYGTRYKGIVLCCHESADNFCHRQVVADECRENGLEIEEFPVVLSPRTLAFKQYLKNKEQAEYEQLELDLEGAKSDN